MGVGGFKLRQTGLEPGSSPASGDCVVELHTRQTAKLAADLSNLMWGADAEGRTTFVSEALLKATGYDEDKLTGAPLAKLLTADDGAELSDDVAGQLLGGEPCLPLRLRTKDGATYRIAWERLPKRDRDGRIVEVMGVARELLPALDPDPLRDAQLDLLDAARTCIIGMRPDGTIAYVNRETECVLGAGRDGLVGRSYFELLAPTDGGTAWRNTKEHIEACLGAHDYETTVVAKSGRRVVMRWSSAPFRSGARPAPDLIFLFGIDVTDQRRRDREQRVRGESTTSRSSWRSTRRPSCAPTARTARSSRCSSPAPWAMRRIACRSGSRW